MEKIRKMMSYQAYVIPRDLPPIERYMSYRIEIFRLSHGLTESFRGLATIKRGDKIGI